MPPSHLVITSLAQAVAAEPSTTLTAALLAAVGALALTVAYLFRHYTKKIDGYDEIRKGTQEAFAKEREAWATERQRNEAMRQSFEQAREEFEKEVRASYEERLRVACERYAESERQHIAQARREFAELMEAVGAQATDAQEKIALVFEKLLDRYAGARTRPKG